MPGKSTRRLRRELGFTVLGISRHLRCPKVSKGRAESPLLAATHGNFAVRESLAGGTDAPTPARTVGLPPRGGQYFLSTRKKVPKKARGTALREKGFYCPFCRRGSQCRAQWSWIVFTSSWSALVLAFFRRQNGQAFFPSLPIAALLPRSWRWADSTSAAWDGSPQLEFFAMQKASGISYPRWLFYASRRACRPTAVFSIQLAGNRTEPASHEACCRAAVTPQPSRMSPYAHARLWRAVWGQGVLPLVRAGGPVARRRSFLFNYQESTPDRRAVAPVVPRR